MQIVNNAAGDLALMNRRRHKAASSVTSLVSQICSNRAKNEGIVPGSESSNLRS